MSSSRRSAADRQPYRAEPGAQCLRGVRVSAPPCGAVSGAAALAISDLKENCYNRGSTQRKMATGAFDVLTPSGQTLREQHSGGRAWNAPDQPSAAGQRLFLRTPPHSFAPGMGAGGASGMPLPLPEATGAAAAGSNRTPTQPMIAPWNTC